ncbi:MAG: hypothetical protein JXA90_04935 [Planctomycetes bacterium]|nr:hypothetical protein [Planctomycetota bacterium]
MKPDPRSPPPEAFRGPTAGPSLEARLEEVERDLGDIFHRLVEERQAATGLGGAIEETTLQIQLKVAPPSAPAPSGGQLYRRLKEAADRAADRFAVFPAGHVYCHWCRSFTCAHSTPPESRSVFAGYSATGQPTWREFASVILERGDPRIEHLFHDDPATIPLFQGGEEIAREQLSVYGKRSPIYRILGQVVVGYMRPPKSHGSPGAPFAVTLQAVEAAGAHCPAQLNVVGRLADGTPAFQALEELFDPRLLDAVQTTRRRLLEISLSKAPRRRRSREKSKQVEEILRRMVKNFDRVFRQQKRRTQHSRDRHLNRRRPAAVAFSDALRARRQAIFRDVEERTWVVLGPKNRVHVFNDEATHITSVVYPGETVRHRTTRGKWLGATEEQAGEFLDALKNRAREPE